MKDKKIIKQPNHYFFEKINKIIFLTIIFFLPFQFGKYFFFDFSYLSGIRVDYLAIKVFLVDIFIFLFFVLNFKAVFSFLLKKIFFIFYFLLILNFVFTKNKILTFFQIIKIFEFLILFILAKKYFLKVDSKKFLIVFLFSGLLELFLSVYQLVFSHSFGGVFYFFGERLISLQTPGIAKITLFDKEFLRPYATFSHPNSLAGFYLLLYFFLLTEKTFNKNIFLKSFSLLLSNILIFLSFSKVAIFCFLILNSFYFLKNFKTKCFVCKTSKIFVPLFLSLIFLQGKTDILTIEKRIELLKNSFLILKDNLFFGVGLNNYLVAQNYLPAKITLFFNQPVHNIFLLILTEVGLVGFFIILFFLLKNKNLLTPNYYLLTIILLFTGFFDHYWLTLNQNFFLIAFVYGSVSSSFLTS